MFLLIFYFILSKHFFSWDVEKQDDAAENCNKGINVAYTDVLSLIRHNSILAV